jgi:hypothetical protein
MLFVGFIFLRKSAVARLRDGGEEVEGGIGDIFGDLGFMYHTSDIKVEWFLRFRRST